MSPLKGADYSPSQVNLSPFGTPPVPTTIGHQSRSPLGAWLVAVALAVCILIVGSHALLNRSFSHLERGLAQVSLIVMVSLLSLTVGPVAARAFGGPLTWGMSRFLRRVSADLQAFARSADWPGYRYLEVMRRANQEERGEFLGLGLDSALPDQSQLTLAFAERMSVALLTLEERCVGAGEPALAATARHARLRAKQLVFARRLTLAVQRTVVVASCVGTALLTVALLGDSYNSVVSQQEMMALVRSLSLLALVAPLVALIGNLLHFSTWSLAQRTKTTLDDVLYQAGAWMFAGLPGLAMTLLALSMTVSWPRDTVGLMTALGYLFVPRPQAEIIRSPSWSLYMPDLGVTELLIVRLTVTMAATALAVLLLRSICNRVLRAVAARTSQKFDDMMVELARIFGTFVLLTMGVGWAIVIIFAGNIAGIDLSQTTNSLMPYAIVVAVGGALLGVGSRQLLENFFAGVSLQIDRPFELGERILLPDGLTYEVRSIGMRSTHLYDLPDNSDVFMPNTQLAGLTISNLSRPDRQQRKTLSFHVRDGPASLARAEGLILLAIYSVDSIDIPVIADVQLERTHFHKERPSIIQEFLHLQSSFEEFGTAAIRLHGRRQSVPELLEACSRRAIANLEVLHDGAAHLWDFSSGWSTTIDVGHMVEIEPLAQRAKEIYADLSDIASCFWTIAANHPSLRPHLDHIIHEMLRAPSLSSRPNIAPLGWQSWQVDVGFYAHLMEMSDEIANGVNLVVQQLLHLFDLNAPASVQETRS